ncbi:10924_t:CDS:2 [Dentiscutata erythropus]|uniref:Ubiquitin-like-conjugating enzyme ATG10 n=1 Tax=Dentiscutata erythropus TaxID=1348616 RepID=A0A9N8VWK1_9GLOM|nr:10924_t:CDS:2 [Dentiscutata erythropus]
MALPDHYPFLTRKEFDIAAKLFIEQSKRSSDEEPWSWVEHEKVKGFGYICRKSLVKRVNPVNFIIPENDFTQIDDEIIEEEDLNSLPTVPVSDEYFTVDYHIVYSTSYKVPVLYFNAYNSAKPVVAPYGVKPELFHMEILSQKILYILDGTLLTNDEIYSNLVHPLKQNDIKTAGFNGAISQQDHPTLLIPFYYLHPCETATLMTSIVSNSKMDNNKLQAIPLEGYIRSWLSLVGSVVGIKVVIDYFI